MVSLSLQVYAFLRRAVRSVVLSDALLNWRIRSSLQALERFLLPWLVRRVGPNPIVYDGIRLFYRPDEDINVIFPILLYGSYEPETTQVFRDLIHPGMNVVDLGAHIGYYTLLGAKLVGPSGRVWAFEPVPSTYELLVKNIKVNGYERIVTSVPCAVADRQGQVRISLVKKASGSASLYTHNHKYPFIEVKAITLDEFFEGEGWPNVDLVKMDIEGAEKVALEKMKKLNEKNPNLKLILEFFPDNLKRAGISPEDLIQLLLKLGYWRFRVLWRDIGDLEMPKDLSRLVELARRQEVNILCEKS